MRLLWARPAADDRKRIRAHIAHDNPAAALALDELFTQKASRLIDHPESARPGRIAGTRELVAHPNYILVYDIVGDQVRILRVLHASQNWPPE